MMEAIVNIEEFLTDNDSYDSLVSRRISQD